LDELSRRVEEKVLTVAHVSRKNMEESTASTVLRCCECADKAGVRFLPSTRSSHFRDLVPRKDAESAAFHGFVPECWQEITGNLTVDGKQPSQSEHANTVQPSNAVAVSMVASEDDAQLL